MVHHKPGNDENILRKMRKALNEDGFQPDRHLLSSLIHSLPLNVFAKNCGGRFIFANDFYCKSIGKKHNEVIGRDDYEIHPPDLADKYRKDDKRIMASRQAEMIEEEWQAIGGERRYMQVIKSPLFNNIHRDQVIGAIGIFWDITDKKKTEIELAEERNLLRTLIDIVPDYIYVKDRESRFILANKAVADLMGAGSPEKLLGRTDHDYYFEPDAVNFRWDEQRVIKEEQAIINKEESFSSRDGKLEWILTSKLPLRNIEGEVAGLVGIGHKITERIVAEQERKQLEKKLLHARKMETVGTLAGGIAHDFNNLLMNIQGHTSLMEMKMGASHPLMTHVNCIKASVANAADLTSQLLGFARGGKYNVTLVAFNKLISKTVEKFGLTRKEIRILKTSEPGLWAVEADKCQMEQVLLNLFINAWQAMPGGGDLSLRTENIQLDESIVVPHSVPPGCYVRISVTDTGKGMDETTRQRIFDPFFTTKEIRRGTGMGLASAYGIVKNHGGFITVYSEPGSGTTFCIYLPAADSEAGKEGRPGNSLEQGAGTILLVDDEALVVDVGKEILEMLGYQVITARGGGQAVEMISEKGDEIDLVILDLVMPGMDGKETFERIREIRQDLPVIVSSGYPVGTQAREIMEKGAGGFIQKPFQISTLSQAIQEVLG